VGSKWPLFVRGIPGGSALRIAPKASFAGQSDGKPPHSKAFGISEETLDALYSQLPYPLLAINNHSQEMGGAGNARIVVPDGLLALPHQLVLRQVEIFGDEVPQVLLDGFLIL